MRLSRFSLVSQSLLYFASGLNHFWHPQFYLNVLPDHYRSHREALVAVSGMAELMGGLGLLAPGTRAAAGAGLTAMLAVFLDVHLDMLRHPERYPAVPEWALVGRIPLQFALMAWAWSAGRATDRPSTRPAEQGSVRPRRARG